MKRDNPTLYDELSRRCFGLDREFIKNYVYMMSYSAPGLDPWLCLILTQELSNIRAENQSL